MEAILLLNAEVGFLLIQAVRGDLDLEVMMASIFIEG
jgi:hypothetical protein